MNIKMLFEISQVLDLGTTFKYILSCMMTQTTDVHFSFIVIVAFRTCCSLFMFVCCLDAEIMQILLSVCSDVMLMFRCVNCYALCSYQRIQIWIKISNYWPFFVFVLTLIRTLYIQKHFNDSLIWVLRYLMGVFLPNFGEFNKIKSIFLQSCVWVIITHFFLLKGPKHF